MDCQKIGYTSYREAQEVLNRAKHPNKYKQRHKGKKDKKLIRSYQCPECDQWHLTSKRKDKDGK